MQGLASLCEPAFKLGSKIQCHTSFYLPVHQHSTWGCTDSPLLCYDKGYPAMCGRRTVEPVWAAPGGNRHSILLQKDKKNSKIYYISLVHCEVNIALTFANLQNH